MKKFTEDLERKKKDFLCADYDTIVGESCQGVRTNSSSRVFPS